MGLPELFCAAVLSVNMPNADLACKHMPELVQASAEHNVKPEVMVALIHVESRWTPKAVSRANACGLTQVIPKWTGGRASGGVKYTCKELYDPSLSIAVGTRIFSYWLRKYGRGNYRIGLCGYNAGYRCKGDAPNAKGMSYSRSVLRKSRQIKRALKRIIKQRKENADTIRK